MLICRSSIWLRFIRKPRTPESPIVEIDWAIDQLQITLVDCDQEQARLIGKLRESTREHGLSLGDRACLALGSIRELPVITSDEQLAKPELSIEVELFRIRGPIRTQLKN